MSPIYCVLLLFGFLALDGAVVNGIQGVPPKGWKHDDIIEVWFLSRPVSRFPQGIPINQLNSMSAAVGFVNNNGKNLVDNQVSVIYTPTGRVLDTLFPQISNSTPPALSWDISGDVGFVPIIDFEYWNLKRLMFTIDGDMFQRYLCWLPMYEESFPSFQLFTIRVNVETMDTYLPSVTFGTFVLDSFLMLWDVGAKPVGDAPSSSLTVPLDFFYLFGTDPVIAKETEDELVAFYEKFQPQSPNDTLHDAVTRGIQNGNVFYYYYLGAYLKTVLAFPYYSFIYADTPVITRGRQPGNVNYQPNCVKEEEGGSSGGWIVLIVLLLIFNYCLIGSIYKSVKLKATGIDRIPHIELFHKCIRKRRQEHLKNMQYEEL